MQEFADVKLLHVDRLFADPWGPEPGPEGPPIKPESRWRFWSRGLAYPLAFNVSCLLAACQAGVQCPICRLFVHAVQVMGAEHAVKQLNESSRITECETAARALAAASDDFKGLEITRVYITRPSREQLAINLGSSGVEDSDSKADAGAGESKNDGSGKKNKSGAGGDAGSAGEAKKPAAAKPWVGAAKFMHHICPGEPSSWTRPEEFRPKSYVLDEFKPDATVYAVCQPPVNQTVRLRPKPNVIPSLRSSRLRSRCAWCRRRAWRRR
jgi:hypothetical protein